MEISKQIEGFDFKSDKGPILAARLQIQSKIIIREPVIGLICNKNNQMKESLQINSNKK